MGHLLRVLGVLLVATSLAFAIKAKEPPKPIEVNLEYEAPLVHAEIAGAGWFPDNPRDVKLGVNGGPTVNAQVLRSYAEGSRPVAIAFVLLGGEVWIGNDSFETVEAARFPDLIGPLEHAIDELRLAERLPAGSEFSIVTYDEGATVRVPLTPIAHLTGASFGTQRDYYKHIGADLVAGIRKGLEQLDQSLAREKILIVLGDGSDTNRASAATTMAELKQLAANHNISVGAVVYKAALSIDDVDVAPFDAQVISSPADFGSGLERILRPHTDRFYASFDIRTLPVFTGRSVLLSVEVPGKWSKPIEMTFPRMEARAQTPPRWSTSGWLQICAAVGLLAMLAAFMRSLARE